MIENGYLPTIRSAPNRNEEKLKIRNVREVNLEDEKDYENDKDVDNDNDSKKDNENFATGMDSKEMTEKFPLLLKNVKDILQSFRDDVKQNVWK
jgi:hypothetical protein